jgi:hypothetical protein
MSRFRAALLLALLGALAAAVQAAGVGAAEKPASAAPGTGPLKVYLVLTPEQSRNTMLVERMHLPSSLAALTWTEFRLEGSGNVELSAGGGYRIVSHEPLSSESLGELGVYAYALKVTWTRAAPAPRKTMTISFSYSGMDAGGVVLQPAQRALLEGIRRSGRQSGAARVLEISYLGGGRFRATVGVR